MQVLDDGLDEALAVLPDLVAQPLVEVEVLPARGHHGEVDDEGHGLRVEEDGERLQVLRHVQDPAQPRGLQLALGLSGKLKIRICSPRVRFFDLKFEFNRPAVAIAND